MPRVYLTKQDEMSNKLVAMIYGTMKVKHVTQTKMADVLEISQQAFGKKLKHKQFTYWDLVRIFKELGFEDEQILSLMRESRGA